MVADFKFLRPRPRNVLSLATHFGNIEALKALLAARANVHARASHRSTALHWACLSLGIQNHGFTGVGLNCQFSVPLISI